MRIKGGTHSRRINLGSPPQYMNYLYNNIGKKIKILAKVLAWIGIAASVISGLGMIIVSSRAGGAMALIGILTMVLGSLLSWVSSFVLYGFGEIVENSALIAGKKEPPSGGREKALLKMKEEGLITEEDYNEKTAE